MINQASFKHGWSRWRPGFMQVAMAGAGILAIVAATVAVTWPYARFLDTTIPGHTDALFGLWRVSWITDAYAMGASLFDAPIFFPATNTLAYSDAILLPGALTAVFQWMGASPLLAYNSLTLFALVWSGCAAAFLCHTVTRQWAPSVIAGLIFTLNPHRMEHLERIELLTSFFTPLFFVCWHFAKTRSSAAWAAATVLCIAGQFLSGMYEGLFLACVAPCALVELFWIEAKARRRVFIGLAAGAGVTAAIVLSYSAPYYQARDQVGERSLAEAASYSATPENFVAVHPRNWLLGPTLSRFGAAERNLFPGVCAIFLGIVGVVAAERRVRLVYAATLLVGLDLSLGTNGLLYPMLREIASPFRGIRVPARAVMMMMLPLAVFAGIGLSWLGRRLNWPARTAVMAVVIALVCAEYRTTPTLWDLDRPMPLVDYGIGRKSVLLEMPLPSPERLDINFDGHYMVSHIGEWPRLLNGYSGRYPEHYIDMLRELRTFPDEGALRSAVGRGATHLLVHQGWMSDRYPAVAEQLLKSREVVFVGTFRELIGEVSVFMFINSRPAR